jgi:hypothetical protein
MPAGEPKPSVPSWHTVATFLENYRTTGDTRVVLPVQGFDGSPVGLFALSQLGTVPADQRDTVRIGAVAVPIDQLATTTPDELLVDLLPRLRPTSQTRRNLAAVRFIGHAIVMSDGQVVGVLAPSDLARAVELSKLMARPPSGGTTSDGTRPTDGQAPPESPHQRDDGTIASAPRHLVS